MLVNTYRKQLADYLCAITIGGKGDTNTYKEVKSIESKQKNDYTLDT